MSMIEIRRVTKDYGQGRGIFEISFSVEEGEVMGFLGPNGAGKTTTIRQLLGFSHPDKGWCRIDGMDCRDMAAKIQRELGYLPGEIALIDDMTGLGFIKFVGAMKGMKDFNLAADLIQRFDLEPSGKLKRMSKGMKQKIGLVCAFMQDPRILILDEPTSGLDPLMQSRFVELIHEEKKKGKTILMSSHMFEEVERTCDRAVIIKEGHLVAEEDIVTLKENKRKIYTVTFLTKQMAQDFAKENLDIRKVEGVQAEVLVKGDLMPFLKAVSAYHVTNLSMTSQNLEDVFMQYYGGEDYD